MVNSQLEHQNKKHWKQSWSNGEFQTHFWVVKMYNQYVASNITISSTKNRANSRVSLKNFFWFAELMADSNVTKRPFACRISRIDWK